MAFLPAVWRFVWGFPTCMWTPTLAFLSAEEEITNSWCPGHVWHPCQKSQDGLVAHFQRQKVSPHPFSPKLPQRAWDEHSWPMAWRQRQVRRKPLSGACLCNQCCCVLCSFQKRCLVLGKDAWCCPVSRGVPSTATHWKCSAPGTKKLYSYGRDFHCAKGTCSVQQPPLYGCFTHEPYAVPRQGLNAVEGFVWSLCTEIHSAQTVLFLSHFLVTARGDSDEDNGRERVYEPCRHFMSFHLQTCREGKKAPRVPDVPNCPAAAASELAVSASTRTGWFLASPYVCSDTHHSPERATWQLGHSIRAVHAVLEE